MGFKENLLKKIQINQLAAKVLRTMGSPDSGLRMDRQAMGQLLEMGAYEYRRERDLDLYFLETAKDRSILVLDNELKIYHTTAEDVAMRKSPTVKEMISIGNAIKILNDKKVVASSKADSLQRVQAELIAALDLSFTETDIEALVNDGRQALKNNYAEGVVEILTLLAELLDWQKAPGTFQATHCQIWGTLSKARPGEMSFGPLVVFSLMRNSLGMIQNPISSLDNTALKRFQQVTQGKTEADITGEIVFEGLKQAVMAKKP